MTAPDPLLAVESTVRLLAARARAALRIPSVPDYAPEPADHPHDERLQRLARVRDTLERARELLEHGGWTAGGWFTVRADGGARAVSTVEALALRRAPSGDQVVGSCLVGALLRLVDDPDTATSVRDVWSSVDELHEALREQRGQWALPVGRVLPPSERHGRLRELTRYNDAPGRTRQQVLDLVDRAVARTIVGACRP